MEFFSFLFSPQVGEIAICWARGENPWAPPIFLPIFFSYQTHQNTIFSPFFSPIFFILPKIYPIIWTLRVSVDYEVTVRWIKGMTNKKKRKETCKSFFFFWVFNLRVKQFYMSKTWWVDMGMVKWIHVFLGEMKFVIWLYNPNF